MPLTSLPAHPAQGPHSGVPGPGPGDPRPRSGDPGDPRSGVPGTPSRGPRSGPRVKLRRPGTRNFAKFGQFSRFYGLNRDPGARGGRSGTPFFGSGTPNLGSGDPHFWHFPGKPQDFPFSGVPRPGSMGPRPGPGEGPQAETPGPGSLRWGHVYRGLQYVYSGLETPLL